MPHLRAVKPGPSSGVGVLGLSPENVLEGTAEKRFLMRRVARRWGDEGSYLEVGSQRSTHRATFVKCTDLFPHSAGSAQNMC
jgi:hypothetical protein